MASSSSAYSFAHQVQYGRDAKNREPDQAPLQTCERRPERSQGAVDITYRVGPARPGDFGGAFDATWAGVKGNDPPVDSDSDEALEAILRRELIEIACFNGVSDPETLRDILLTRRPPAKPAQ